MIATSIWLAEKLHQFFNPWEAKPKPIAPCTRDSSRALSKLQVNAANSVWIIALFSPVVIGHSNYFGIAWLLNSHLKTALSERCLVRFTGRVSTRTVFVFASERFLVNKEQFSFGLKRTESEHYANTSRRRLG